MSDKQIEPESNTHLVVPFVTIGLIILSILMIILYRQTLPTQLKSTVPQTTPAPTQPKAPQTATADEETQLQNIDIEDFSADFSDIEADINKL